MDDVVENGSSENPVDGPEAGMEANKTRNHAQSPNHLPHQDAKAEDGQVEEAEEDEEATTNLHKDQLKHHIKEGDLITEYQACQTFSLP